MNEGKTITYCLATKPKMVTQNKHMELFRMVQSTVPFNSVWQSHIMGPSKLLKCHIGHGNFYEVPKSFGDPI